ncbi:hypothetical protein QBC42DRAFT_254723 [Cladorrhinum samala]|uniref:Uncharacterized protein n=1 Tax=Cladorrhinum samala TaxID=585594 RepID=A0AAV9HE74_9PEZI|nr:hypothetical protein QBC42DRAFT_254723 [Cladorrhinum samala]
MATARIGNRSLDLIPTLSFQQSNATRRCQCENSNHHLGTATAHSPSPNHISSRRLRISDAWRSCHQDVDSRIKRACSSGAHVIRPPTHTFGRVDYTNTKGTTPYRSIVHVRLDAGPSDGGHDKKMQEASFIKSKLLATSRSSRPADPIAKAKRDSWGPKWLEGARHGGKSKFFRLEYETEFELARNRRSNLPRRCGMVESQV